MRLAATVGRPAPLARPVRNLLIELQLPEGPRTIEVVLERFAADRFWRTNIAYALKNVRSRSGEELQWWRFRIAEYARMVDQPTSSNGVTRSQIDALSDESVLFLADELLLAIGREDLTQRDVRVAASEAPAAPSLSAKGARA